MVDLTGLTYRVWSKARVGRVATCTADGGSQRAAVRRHHVRQLRRSFQIPVEAQHHQRHPLQLHLHDRWRYLESSEIGYT